MEAHRAEDLKVFYSLLSLLEERVGGARRLADCSGSLPWPTRGVYFFHEPGEERSATGTGPRIVRVGTHALNAASGTKLWTRLSQHRGQMKAGGGNHRGSIFRLIVGTALIAERPDEYPTWGRGNTATKETRACEAALEGEVSRVIGVMPFLWLPIDDLPGPDSLRGYIERNTIALLSNYNRPALDLPSEGWLGHRCNRERVRKSGLWNSNHVDETYDRRLLERLEQRIAEMPRA